MPTVKIMDLTSAEVGEIELADVVFGVALNEPLIHEAVRSFLANRRAGTSVTASGRVGSVTTASIAVTGTSSC